MHSTESKTKKVSPGTSEKDARASFSEDPQQSQTLNFFINALNRISQRSPHKALSLTLLSAILCAAFGFDASRQGFSSNALWLLTAFFAAVSGVLACASWYNSLLKQIHKIMLESSASDRLVDIPLQKTGVRILDDLAKFHSRKISSLLEVIDTIQTNSENLLERYRILTENLAASIIIRDLNGKIIYASPYSEVLTGYSLSEIYAAEDDFFSHIVLEEDREKYSRALKISAMGESFNLLYRALHKTGMEMWFETRTEPVINERNEIVSYLSVTLDVTRTMRYQKQVEEKNRDLHDFAYMVSHDLKAPIFTIKGMVNMLEEDLKEKLDAESIETLTHITKASQTLEKLVSSVLEYSRISAQDTKLEKVVPAEVFADIINDFTSQIALAKAKIEISPEIAPINGDKLKVYQIFSNLMGNALKFRDPQRELNIKIYQEKTKIEREVRIAFCDNGLGIPADKLESIFRPFHRAHGKSIEGSGIGLACVKRLLEKIGGSVEVKSQEGQGSVFILTFRHSD